MRNLSSYFTAFHLIVMPLVLLWVFVSNTIFSVREAKMPETLVIWMVLGLFCLISLKFSWNLCFASIDGDQLHLRSYRGRATVPLREITSIRGHSRSKTPNIEINFRSRTNLGKKIVIIPPGSFSNNKFWDVYELLAAAAEKAAHDGNSGGNAKPFGISNTAFATVIWVMIVLIILGFYYLA